LAEGLRACNQGVFNVGLTMTLEIVVASLAVLAYLFGSYADEQRSRREGRKLRRLRDEKSERPRMPLPSSP
jgi:hypothetical protein